MRSDTERLRDIQEAITNIEKYKSQGKEAFLLMNSYKAGCFYNCRSLAKPPDQ